MAYDYRIQRPNVFKEDNQKMFLQIRDNAKCLIGQSGAVTSGKLMKGCTGDSWDMMACIDRLVEIGELVEIPNTYCKLGQDRIFVSPYQTKGA